MGKPAWQREDVSQHLPEGRFKDLLCSIGTGEECLVHALEEVEPEYLASVVTKSFDKGPLSALHALRLLSGLSIESTAFQHEPFDRGSSATPSTCAPSIRASPTLSTSAPHCASSDSPSNSRGSTCNLHDFRICLLKHGCAALICQFGAAL